ncbi:MAG: glycine zipper 2TM domain-containing protein [Pseudomonadota bacterium]
MSKLPTSRGPHAMLILASAAVVLFCVTGTAAILGWIPSSIGGNTHELSEAERMALAARMQPQAPAADHTTLSQAPPMQLAAATPKPESASTAPPAKSWCHNCGNVESVREITTRAKGSGAGAVGGALLGGLLGNQIGSGHGRQAATVAGAVGGAVVGNQVEGNMKATHSYEIKVRLDDGSARTFHQATPPGWHNGDRVEIVKGALRPVH